MHRANLFLIILVASLAALVFVVVVGVAIFSSSPWSWAGGFPGGMMGNDGMMGGTVQNLALPYFGVAFVVLIVVVVVGVIGLAYYVVVPEIRASAAPAVCENVLENDAAPQGSGAVEEKKEPKAACTPLESIIKTLTDDERNVVEVLKTHEGKYLQKYIRGEAGLSRLQTHRVVARLAERGIVTLEKMGNTNQVLLADWLKK
jgi:hypothetical protein